MRFLHLTLGCSVLGLSLGCGADDGDGSPGAAGAGGSGAGGNGGFGGSSTCTVQVPDAYDGVGYDANVAVELDIIARFNAFMLPMKDAEASASVTVTADELKALFDAGTPSLRSLTSSYYAGKIDVWLGAFADATGQSWAPSEPPSATGGIYEKWIFDERGTDLRQAIEKGMFGASHYAHALAITTDAPDAATIDRVLSIYGAHPSFPHDDKALENPDQFSATYAKRRDDKSDPEPGFYRKLKASFITARTTAAAGDDCVAERDSAVAAIKSDWEKMLFATVIYYSNDGIKKLTVDPPTDADLAAGLHSIGEATGFVHGFRQLDATKNQITDAQIDELLVLLNAPASGPVDTYKFATDTASEIGKLQQVIAKVQSIYGFSDAEVDKFKLNY
jgi:hypothetical protein